MESKDFRDEILKLETMAKLSEEVREKVANIIIMVAKLRSVPKGSTWIREGEHSENKGYILLRGTIDIYKADHPVLKCDAPELLGEIMQFNPSHLRTATVRASSDCIVLRFIWDDFWEAAERFLAANEQKELKGAVEGCAWRHFAD